MKDSNPQVNPQITNYNHNSIMANSTVFITGATGFIGAQVTLATLQAGYNVKLSVRKEGQIGLLRQVFKDFASKLDFVVVPNYTVINAFVDALQDVDYVIHLASPLAIPGQDLLTPAVKGTTSILAAADRYPRIKKVVITASVLSLVPMGGGGDGTYIKGRRTICQCCS